MVKDEEARGSRIPRNDNDNRYPGQGFIFCLGDSGDSKNGRLRLEPSRSAPRSAITLVESSVIALHINRLCTVN